MPRVDIEHATLVYSAADEDTAAAVQELNAEVLAALKVGLGFHPQTHVRIRVVHTWFSFAFRGVGWVQFLLSVLTLPVGWYWLQFARFWDHAYAAAWIRGKRNVSLNVKSLRRLPQGDPPQLNATYVVQPPPRVDRRTLWREEVCRQLVAAYLFWRLPRELGIGVADFIADRIVPTPGCEPAVWRPIMKFAGQLRPFVDFRRFDELSQAAVDELYARRAWPWGVVRFLEARHPGLLRNVLARALPRERVVAQLCTDLGMPSANPWFNLADAAASYLDGDTGITGAPVASEVPAASEGSQSWTVRRVGSGNPYQSPGAEMPQPEATQFPPSVIPLLAFLFITACGALGCWFAAQESADSETWARVLAGAAGFVTGLLIGQVAYVLARIAVDLSPTRTRAFRGDALTR